MIDLLILILVAWGAVIGWSRGGFRSLIDCVSAGCAVAVMLFSIPFLKDGLLDSFWAHELRHWINDHLQAVPASFGFDTVGSGMADKLYHLIVTGLGAIAVFIGIQILLHVFVTLGGQPVQRAASRITGSMAGGFMGGMVAVYVVQCLGLLTWIKGLEIVDLYLAKSFLRWVSIHYLLM